VEGRGNTLKWEGELGRDLGGETEKDCVNIFGGKENNHQKSSLNKNFEKKYCREGWPFGEKIKIVRKRPGNKKGAP